METCNKIVRNNIPNILEELGKKFDIELLESDKGLEFLYLSLISTIYDSFENKSLDNISEAIELLRQLLKSMDILNKILLTREIK